MKKVLIGKGLEMDVASLIESRLLWQANSGGGKSWALRRFLEQTHGMVQQIVLDIEGEFNTLREKFDYILVGNVKQGADIPVSIRTAELLARKLLEIGTSAIIDLYELKAHERILFVKRFLDAMVNADKSLWHPCLVIVDEAHVFCPEQGHSEAMGSVIDLCTRGRKRGYCAVLATQRLSKLHKDAAAECNNKFIGRSMLDVDMKRAAAELGFTSKKDILSLRQLEKGEFYAFGPALSNEIIKVKVGPVQTTHPEAGGRQALVAPPAPSKVKAMLAKLADLPQEADEELKSLQDYKNKVHELKLQLRKQPEKIVQKPVVDEKAVQKAQEKGYCYARDEFVPQIRVLEKEKALLIREMSSITKIAQKCAAMPASVVVVDKKLPIINAVPKPTNLLVFPVVKEAKESMATSVQAQNDDGAPLRAGAMKMLGVCAMFRENGVSKQRLATLSGFTMSGGTFQAYLSELKKKGWVKESGELLQITEDGDNAAIDVPPLPESTDALVDLWASKFRAGAAKMLRLLVEIYPQAVSKEELGERTGFTSSGGTFQAYLSELKNNGLAVVQDGEVKASEELFV